MNTVRARQPHVRRTRLSNQFVASPTKRYCPLQISNPGPGNARSETCARRAQVPRCAPGASGRAFCMCVCVRVRDPPQAQRGSLSRSWHVIAKPEWQGARSTLHAGTRRMLPRAGSLRRKALLHFASFRPSFTWYSARRSRAHARSRSFQQLAYAATVTRSKPISGRIEPRPDCAPPPALPSTPSWPCA